MAFQIRCKVTFMLWNWTKYGTYSSIQESISSNLIKNHFVVLYVGFTILYLTSNKQTKKINVKKLNE